MTYNNHHFTMENIICDYTYNHCLNILNNYNLSNTSLSHDISTEQSNFNNMQDELSICEYDNQYINGIINLLSISDLYKELINHNNNIYNYDDLYMLPIPKYDVNFEFSIVPPDNMQYSIFDVIDLIYKIHNDIINLLSNDNKFNNNNNNNNNNSKLQFHENNLAFINKMLSLDINNFDIFIFYETLQMNSNLPRDNIITRYRYLWDKLERRMNKYKRLCYGTSSDLILTINHNILLNIVHILTESISDTYIREIFNNKLKLISHITCDTIDSIATKYIFGNIMDIYKYNKKNIWEHKFSMDNFAIINLSSINECRYILNIYFKLINWDKYTSLSCYHRQKLLSNCNQITLNKDFHIPDVINYHNNELNILNNNIDPDIIIRYQKNILMNELTNNTQNIYNNPLYYYHEKLYHINK